MEKLPDLYTGIKALLIFTAILAVPVSIGSKLVKANLSGYGWAFVASLLVVALHAATSLFTPVVFLGLPIAAVGSIFIYSYALGTTLPKASTVYCISLLSFILVAVLFVVAFGVDAEVELYGFKVTFHR